MCLVQLVPLVLFAVHRMCEHPQYEHAIHATNNAARENGLHEDAYDFEFTSVYASKSTALVLENATHRAAPLVIEGY